MLWPAGNFKAELLKEEQVRSAPACQGAQCVHLSKCFTLADQLIILQALPAAGRCYFWECLWLQASRMEVCSSVVLLATLKAQMFLFADNEKKKKREKKGPMFFTEVVWAEIPPS